MNNITNRPDPNAAFPNPNLPRLCFIKNVVKNPRIVVGDYTYYDDVDGADQFEKHVTHFLRFYLLGTCWNSYRKTSNPGPISVPQNHK